MHPQQGGGGAAGIRLIFQGRGTGGTALCIGNLGGHQMHGKGPGGVSDRCGDTADGTAPVEDNGWELEINLGRNVKEGRWGY